MKEYLKKITKQIKECTNKVCTKISDCWCKFMDWWEWNRLGFLIVFALFAMVGFLFLGVTINGKREAVERATWELKENFVKRQGKYYIYREEIEGHQYYVYKFDNGHGHLEDWQVVPVNYCEEE